MEISVIPGFKTWKIHFFTLKNATNFSQFLFLNASPAVKAASAIRSHIESAIDVVLSLLLSLPVAFSESHRIQSCQFLATRKIASKNGFASSYRVTRIRCGGREILLHWVLFRRSKDSTFDSTKFSDTCCVTLLCPFMSSLNIHSCQQQKSQFNSLATTLLRLGYLSARPPSKLAHLANEQSSPLRALQFNLWRNNRCKS